MTNRTKGIAKTLLILGALVVSVRQRSDNGNGISRREPEVTQAAARRAIHQPTGASPRKQEAPLSDQAISQTSEPAAPDLAVFGAFDTWVGKYQAAPVPSAELEAAGEQIAVQREEALAQLIKTNPELALQKAIPYEQRKILPQSILRHVEEPVSGMARYEVIGLAPGTTPPGSPSVERYVTLNNRTFTASVYGRRVTLPSKPEIAIHGIAIRGALAVAEHPVRVLGAAEAEDRAASVSDSEAFCPVSKAPGKRTYAAEVAGRVRYFCHDGHIEALNKELEAAETGPTVRRNSRITTPDWTVGDKSLLFIRVNFPDKPAETISVEAANRLIDAVNGFFAKNSYDKFSVHATVTPLITMPQNSDAYTRSTDESVNFDRVMTDARAAALAAGYDTSEFDLDCVHLDGHVVSARGYIGDKGATLQDLNVGTACHELGHNLGLWHANAWATTDGSIIGEGSNLEYGNRVDTMGSGGDYQLPFNVYNRWSLNWLPESAVKTVTGDGVYTLYPFDVESIESGRAYALRLPKDPARDYWIETRQSRSGELLFNWSPWRESNGGTDLLDMTPASDGGFYDAGLEPGQSFYDPELGIKITPLRLSVTEPGAVDVLIKHVHYLAVDASRPDTSTGYGITVDENSGVQTLTLGPNGSATFTMNVASAGDYSLVGRVLGPGGPVSVRIDQQATANWSLEPGDSSNWRWSRVLSSIAPASFSLSAGQHTVRISGGTSDTRIDSILLTDDSSTDLPPIIEQIPDQTATLGQKLVVNFSVLSPEVGIGTAAIAARSSNGLVVPDDQIVTEETAASQKTWLAVTPSRVGQTVITVMATTADGRSGTASFNLTVVGPVQAMVEAASPGDTVRLPAGVLKDRLTINKNITLEGVSAATTIIDGNYDGPTITVGSAAVVTLRDLTVRHGTGGIINLGVVEIVDCEITQNLNSPRGGGIRNELGAQMSLQGTTVSSNRSSGPGGGIYNLGAIGIVNSTISVNRSTAGEGGGINNAGQMDLAHVTVTLNRARAGAGVANTGTIEMSNTILAGNTADVESSADLKGAILSQGYNLIQVTAGATMQGNLVGNITGRNALLGPLADNGGPTHTHALLAGSPAIDAGDFDGLATDQRGNARVQHILSVPSGGDGADIGAYELRPGEHATGISNSGQPQLNLRRTAEGEVVVALEGGSSSAWTLQATSDFVSWQTVGTLGKGQAAELKDPAAHGVARRFYRVVPH